MTDAFTDIRVVKALLQKHINSNHQLDQSENVTNILNAIDNLDKKLTNICEKIDILENKEPTIITEKIVTTENEQIVDKIPKRPLLKIDFQEKEFIPDIDASLSNTTRLKDVEAKQTKLKSNLSIFEQILGDK
jgi:hypothetical protein